MIFNSKNKGIISNIIGICRLYGIKESYIDSHNFGSDLKCVNCNNDLNYFRDEISDCMRLNITDKQFLTCNEIIIKRLLE